MTLACLNIPLDEKEQKELEQAFYLYKVKFCFNKEAYLAKDPAFLQQLEIFCGEEENIKDLDDLPYLKWLHITAPFIGNMQLKQECKKRSILLSHSRSQEAVHVAEYVLTWANLLLKGICPFIQKKETLDSPYESLSIKGRRFLQIGVGHVGSEIAKHANMLGYRVWGVRKRSFSFHPYCEKTFSLDNLHSLLSTSDVICCSIPRDGLRQEIFPKATLKHIKPGAVLIFLSGCESVDMPGLKEVLEQQQLRGVLIDTAKRSFWEYKDVPGLYLSPLVAPTPSLSSVRALPIFRRNLWKFLHGNFYGMENLS